MILNIINLIFFLSCPYLIFSNTSKIISLPFLTSDALAIKFTMGSQKRLNYLILNQEIQYLWTISHFWNLSSSSTGIQLGNTTIDHISGNFEAKDIEDMLHFKAYNKSVQLRFKYSNYFKFIPFSSGEVGLPFKFNDDKYSLVHALKSNNLIDHLSYGIVFYNDTPINYNADKDEKGELYFGGLPDEATKGKKAFSCKVDERYSKWGCLFKSMTIIDVNGTHFASNQLLRSFFQANEEFIHVPYDYYSYLKDTFFKKHLNSQACYESTFQRNYYIYCKGHVIPQLDRLIFRFEDITFTLPSRSIVENFGLYKMIMIKNEKKQNEYWEFGYTFIKPFTTLFDYEGKVITFYEANDSRYIKSNYEVCILLFWLLLFFCLIGVILLFMNCLILKRIGI